MKLGDNMAPIEACNVWNDVCPRKTRPPKIGDIPRHVAVDEESPGSSTSRSVGQVQEAPTAPTAASKSMLERSAISPTSHGKPASSARSVLPALETFAKPPTAAPSKRVDQVPRNPVELVRAETPKRSSNSDSSIRPTETLNGPTIFNEISATLRASKNQQLSPLESLGKNPSVQLSRSIGETTKFYEDETPGEIIQVRKDSALYIDEKSDEAAELRDSLVAIGVVPRSSSGINDQQVEEAVNSRLAKPRARRESSGYFSNLGTFDEDRWAGGSSVVDPASQQDRRDSLSTRDSHRGRSGAKNRISMGGGQQVNRMTSLVCPASDETVVSSTDGDAAKTGRVEMPNIDEQTSLELNKSLDCVVDKTKRDIEAEMSGEKAQILSGNSSSRTRESKSRVETSAGLEAAAVCGIEDAMRNRNARISMGNSESKTWEAKSRAENSAEVDEAVSEMDGELRNRTARISLGNSESKTREAKSRAENSAEVDEAVSEIQNRTARISLGNSSSRIQEAKSRAEISVDLDEPADVTLPEVEGEKRKIMSHLSPQDSSSKTQTLKSRAENSAVAEKTGCEFPKNVDETQKSGDKLGNVDQASQSQWSTSSRAASRQRNRMVVHQYSSPNITSSELTRIVERPHSENFVRSTSEFQRPDATNSNVINIVSPTEDSEEDEEEEDDDNEQVVAANLGGSERSGESEADARKLLPRSIKVYQLLSTQSEDRGDGDARLFDRRISLQIPRQEEEATRGNSQPPTISAPTVTEYVEEKKLVHADSVPILKIPSSDSTNVENELRLCVGGRTLGSGNPSGPTIPGIRPIYPYCPYSPYASPQGSPRTNRRRPLRESRRVSIDSRQGALQLNQYKLLNNIGQGSYGIVKLAYNEEDETHYAMKILSKKKLMKKAGIFGRIAPGRKGVANPLAKVYREIALLKKLDHPNVVKLVEVLDDPDEDNLYLVFELVQRGEVLQLPAENPLDEETARIHFRDVVMGVEYLHYQRIVHRDIKPSNLLVDSEGRVKVADLGVSAELRAAGELLSGSAGTPAFAAPETTTPGAQYSGTLCDVWSMGVTLYSLVTGKVPWDGAGSIIGVQSAVRTEPLRFPESPRLSDDLRDLVSRMLAKDPARRITLAEIKEHPWLTKNGEEPLPNEADNCRLPVTVTDEEVARVVTRVPKLDTLILIKTMLKQHSFQNPFLPRRIVRSGCTTGDPSTSGSALKQQASSDTTDSSTELLPTAGTLKSKTEQFHKAGRSNSAPDSYEWQTNGRQISSDSLLPPVTESSSQEQQAEVEKR